MARRFTIELLMDLASQAIGANPAKNFMGTKTNISFLGKGPQQNPLFQNPLPDSNATEANLRKTGNVIQALLKMQSVGRKTANSIVFKQKF